MKYNARLAAAALVAGTLVSAAPVPLDALEKRMNYPNLSEITKIPQNLANPTRLADPDNVKVTADSLFGTLTRPEDHAHAAAFQDHERPAPSAPPIHLMPGYPNFGVNPPHYPGGAPGVQLTGSEAEAKANQFLPASYPPGAHPVTPTEADQLADLYRYNGVGTGVTSMHVPPSQFPHQPQGVTHHDPYAGHGAGVVPPHNPYHQTQGAGSPYHHGPAYTQGVGAPHSQDLHYLHGGAGPSHTYPTPPPQIAVAQPQHPHPYTPNVQPYGDGNVYTHYPHHPGYPYKK